MVADDIRHYSEEKRSAGVLAPTISRTVWAGPFDSGENKQKRNFAIADFVVHYGMEGVTPGRLIFARFACDILLGSKSPTDCVQIKEQDVPWSR